MPVSTPCPVRINCVRTPPNPGRETQSRLIRDQHRAGDADTAHPRLTPDKQRISDSPEGISDDAPEGAQLCKASDGRRCHDSPEAYIHPRGFNSQLRMFGAR
jgi:hypothetical protein